MMRKRNIQIYLLSVACIFLNFAGKFVADRCSMPFWLDFVGTSVMAYAYGPVCGAIVGVSTNILCALLHMGAVYYAFTSLAIAVLVGLCGKKGFFESAFGTLSVAFLATILATIVSVPINYLVSDGSIDNVWGNAVSAFLQEAGFNRGVGNVAGQLYLEFLDKVITLLLLYWGLCILHHKKTIKKEKSALPAIFLLFCSMMVFFSPENVYAGTDNMSASSLENYDFERYVQTVYNGENGLPGGEANDIAQTKDGVLWVGTYGGLYRYNGSQFRWMNEFASVKTVNCMYTDEAGHLWIGTNDDGLSICIDDKISNVVNREDGLPSDSVRCITESSDGLFYVGTTGSLVVMTMNGGLKVTAEIPEVVYADVICSGPDKTVAAVTNEGAFYLIQGTDILLCRKVEREGESYNCCMYDEEGRLYLGTSSNRIEVYEQKNGKLKLLDEILCGDLVGINTVNMTENGTIFICADNGIGYLDYMNEFCPLDSGNFNSSIDHMLQDYQGNLWFTSSRLGLMSLCPSAFTELFKEADIPEQVVNSVTRWLGRLYYGTDNGLKVASGDGSRQMTSALEEHLKGVRIRCLMVDSKRHLWICTSDQGIWEVLGNGEYTVYNSNRGALGEKFRSSIEMEDGTMAVAGDSGITFIKDQKVTHTIGSSDGLENPKILSLYESSDGNLLAGTDGNGIAIIQKGKVIKNLKKEDGLSSEIILRMVADYNGHGLFIVTGNGICYMNDSGEIRLLDQFPYYNNYDLVDCGNGKLFVMCSAGIYVVDKEELLEGKEVSYELLDSSRGLRMSLTPNSWNHMDESRNLYLSGDRGVIRLNLNQYDVTERSYRMLLKSVVVDGEALSVEKGEPIYLPSGAKRIEINPEIVNYSINNPSICIRLEGYDKDTYVMKQSEMTPLVYTNLAAGEYLLRVAVQDDRTSDIYAENTYRIIKKKEFYDYWWFKFYLGAVAVMMISYLTWLFFRTQIQKTLKMQKMELDLAKRQLEMGNDTIMTIAQAVDAKDVNTSQHSMRVSEYAVKIAKRLGYSKSQCEELKNIAGLHDIGKIGIPDQILNKPGKLTDEEYALMKSHVEIGAEILKNLTWIDHVTDGALYHHERYDGKGYVHGLKGEEIPLNARIIGIADAFDAMTANRVYRQKLDFEYVLEELKRGRGTQFDPKLVDILLSLIEDGTIDVNKIYQSPGNKEHKE